MATSTEVHGYISNVRGARNGESSVWALWRIRSDDATRVPQHRHQSDLDLLLPHLACKFYTSFMTSLATRNQMGLMMTILEVMGTQF